MLFKNWKHVFKLTYQTDLFLFKDIKSNSAQTEDW